MEGVFPVIVSNNCTASFVYTIFKEELNSPFSWCRIDDIRHFSYLVGNFDRLDFNDIKFYKTKIRESNDVVCRALLCGKIDILFPHYIEKKQKDVAPMTLEYHGFNRDLVVEDVIGFVERKWRERTARMVEALRNGAKLMFVAAYIGNMLHGVRGWSFEMSKIGKCKDAILVTELRDFTKVIEKAFGRPSRTVLVTNRHEGGFFRVMAMEIARRMRIGELPPSVNMLYHNRVTERGSIRRPDVPANMGNGRDRPSSFYFASQGHRETKR